MVCQERSQLDRLASSFGHGTKPKLANEPGYQSRDLRCDDSRTPLALTLSWHKGGMEHPPGDKRTQDCSAARLCGLWVKIKHATKSSTYRTEMSIAGGNCGMSSLPSTTFQSQSRSRCLLFPR